MIAETHTLSSTGVSKILKRRVFTKLGLILALFVGVGVSTLLITLDGSLVTTLPKWFDTNHWLTTGFRVGFFLAAIITYYSVRNHSIQGTKPPETSAEQVKLKARVRQLLLWFAGFELLFGQALLPRVLEFVFA